MAAPMKGLHGPLAPRGEDRWNVDTKPGLSVVIPAFNEELRIGSTIETISTHLNGRALDYEILVVSDGSTDDTNHIVESCIRRNGRVRLISYFPNKGKGRAVRTGMLAARAPNVLLSDADLATPINELEKLERTAANGIDVVVGSRALRDSVIIGWRPWHREVSGKTFNKLVRLCAVPGILDTQCGFKYFAHGSAARIFSVARLDGYGFDVEALFLARKFGYRIGETAVSWNNSPATKVSVLRDTLPMLRELIMIRLNDWKGSYEGSSGAD